MDLSKNLTMQFMMNHQQVSNTFDRQNMKVNI